VTFLPFPLGLAVMSETAFSTPSRQGYHLAFLKLFAKIEMNRFYLNVKETAPSLHYVTANLVIS